MSSQDAYETFYTNTGLGASLVSSSVGYEETYFNVGLEVPSRYSGHETFYLGDVSTNVPVPEIFFIKPTSGREGDGFDIYGMGFGSSQPVYNAVVQLNPGLDGINPTGLSITSWTNVAADSAYATEDVLLTSLDTYERFAVDLYDPFITDGVQTQSYYSTSGSGSWVVAGGLIGPPSGVSTRCFFLFDALIDTYVTVTVDTTPTDTGILFRWIDTNNYVYFRADDHSLRQVLGGVASTLFDVAGSAVAGDQYQVSASGTTVTVKKNGTTLSTGTMNAAFSSADIVGLVAASSSAKFRDFRVNSPSTEGRLVDTEHTIISVVIPTGAVPPGYLVEVTTNA